MSSSLLWLCPQNDGSWAVLSAVCDAASDAPPKPSGRETAESQEQHSLELGQGQGQQRASPPSPHHPSLLPLASLSPNRLAKIKMTRFNDSEPITAEEPSVAERVLTSVSLIGEFFICMHLEGTG